MNAFWNGLSRGARAGLLAGVLLVLLALGCGSWWLIRPNYQTLFSDLKPQDMAAMTAELERLKVAYQVSDDGGTILVDKALVHPTRIKLMGKELPLHGAVGLELFNNTDFGMTEFAQKINYQRALQGELTRTILSLNEVRDVRVHLALPEQGLFKQATSKAKASITITLRQGQALRSEQVKGISRLVAASVPGMQAQDVTILDNQGVTLSRASAEGELDADSARMDLKRETEAYLSKKAGAVLERVFGPGQTLVSVDVVLNMDQVRTTTEEVLPSSTSRGNAAAAGVVVREKTANRDASVPAEPKAGADGLGAPAARSNAMTQREVEYQVGRRVEQVISHPGTVRSIQAVAVVLKSMDAGQEEQVRRMVAAAVGAAPDRGDAVVVQTFNGGPAWGASAADQPSPTAPAAANAALAAGGAGAMDVVRWLGALLLLACALAGAAWWWRRRGWSATAHRTREPTLTELTAAQRQAVFERVRDWMQQPAVGDRPQATNPTR